MHYNPVPALPIWRFAIPEPWGGQSMIRSMNVKTSKTTRHLFCLAMTCYLTSAAALAQTTAQIDFVSVGRGAPMLADMNDYNKSHVCAY